MGVPLHKDALNELAGKADLPKYNVNDVTSSILHIGPSAFFRAHLAVMIDDLLAKRAAAGQPLNRGIIAVSLKNSNSADKPSVRDTLAGQDNLYTLVEKGEKISNPRVIGSIQDVMVAQEHPEATIEAAADPAIEMISLTVTQAGYYFEKENGLDFDAEDIQKCLDENSPEMSSIGLIVASLALRKERGITPPVIMSCDNLSGNGTKLRNAVLAYARVKDESLAQWIGQHTKFPNNMVDRITPKTTDEHTKSVEAAGVTDGWGIQTENMPNLPLVIELQNSQDVPKIIQELESVGAKITNNVAPYESLKVRTLNGVHMALGCIGHLSGYEFSHEAMADNNIRSFARGFMEEVGATLYETEGVNQDEFREDVLRRLDNAEICDQLIRLSRNGSDKVATRFNETLTDILTQSPISDGTNSDNYSHLSFALASWVEYMKGLDSEGRFKDADPEDGPNDTGFAESGLSNLITEDMTDPRSIFALEKLFGNSLAKASALQESVKGHLELIHEHGMARALEIFVESKNHLHHSQTAEPTTQLEQPAGAFLPQKNHFN